MYHILIHIINTVSCIYYSVLFSHDMKISIHDMHDTVRYHYHLIKKEISNQMAIKNQDPFRLSKSILWEIKS